MWTSQHLKAEITAAEKVLMGANKLEGGRHHPYRSIYYMTYFLWYVEIYN